MPSVKPISVWFIGLPCSGKTTLSQGVYSRLEAEGFKVRILDGDLLRMGLNNNLGFSVADRKENIRRVAEVNKLFLEEGYVILNALICPLQEMRTMVSSIVGKERYFEVFVDAPPEVCEKRDTKGMYNKARKGEIADFTGINSPFEPPANPDVIIRTHKLNIAASVEHAFNIIKTKL